MLASVALDLHHGTDLLTGVFRIPLIDDVPKRGELIITLGAVHAIVDSNKVNVMLREHDLGIHAHLQIITAQA